MAQLSDVLHILASNPQGYLVMAVQFLLGLALGYVAVKALKYIVALFAILALGSFLSVWSLGGSPQEALRNLGMTWELLKSVATLIGLMTLGPVAVGFIVGVVVALIRR